MQVYFDSKDLIDIIEKSTPCSADDLENRLISGSHELVLSFITVMEISEPLLHKKAKTNVMKLLNRIDKMPHTFIHSSSLPRLELEEALSAFSEGREYKDINPYVRRFDEACDLNKKPATRLYINYPLSETVWDLYTQGAIGGLDAFANKLRKAFDSDRSMKKKPSLKENFINKIERTLRQSHLRPPASGVESFSNWIYEKPSRCPSERLGYEVFHKMLKNITDIPSNSDMEDINHLSSLPYIDLMTLDRRMYGYVDQASRSLDLKYNLKAYKKSKEILDWL